MLRKPARKCIQPVPYVQPLAGQLIGRNYPPPTSTLILIRNCRKTTSTLLYTGRRIEILNMFDTGTRCGERVKTTSRSADEMKQKFGSKWFYYHGAHPTSAPTTSFAGQSCRGFSTNIPSPCMPDLHARTKNPDESNGTTESSERYWTGYKSLTTKVFHR